MTRLIRLTAAAVVLLPAPTLTGCNNDAKPNPDLKVPDVPPGGRDTKGAGMMTKDKDKDKDKKKPN